MTTKTLDAIRSFGMSTLLVTDELRATENLLGIELGHSRTIASSPSAGDLYPQFERSVRLEASAMAKNYEIFYCLENAVRKLISEMLEENAGKDWWESGKIPADIAAEVKRRMKTELNSGVTPRSVCPIDYTTFGELSGIISLNWNLFETIFDSQPAVQRVLANLNTLRAPIAHCCQISEDEILRLRLSVRDWFRLIG